MDNQGADCGEPRDAEDGDKDPSSSGNADDRTRDPSCSVTETSGSDQPHTTEDQDETTVKMSEKLFSQPGETSRSCDEMDLSPIRYPSVDPLVQFSNSSIVSGSENRNTHRKTGADMRILATYMRSLNELRAPENIPPTDLDKYLSSFFLVVKKTDGSEYEPCSLRAMLASIERYLRQKNYPASLTRDNDFSNMRNVLKLKQQMLRSLGKGQKTVAEISQTACAREGKISRLFESHEMGPYNPNSVIFSLCFFFCMYLKLRKSTEHKKLLWGDIILCQDYNNREYLTFSPQILGRIHSSQRLNHRLANARVWAEPENPQRDPVVVYKLYAQKRPPSMREPFAPFYLGINLLNPVCGQSWYRPSAMGINKLNEMVRQIRDLTGLKSSTDTSPLQYLAPGSQDNMLPAISEVSNASSDPSNSRDYQAVDGSDIDGRDLSPSGSPQLTIDADESCDEPINATTSFAHESDSNNELSPKSPSNERSLSKSIASSLLYSSFAAAAHSGDVFQHQVANMNVAKAREMMAQSSEELDEEEEGDDDFISVEQAKELVTDIVQRMDIMDMAQFDKWLKHMTITRDPFTGQVACKDPKKGVGSYNMRSQDSGLGHSEDLLNNEPTNMSILLNIALTPTALKGRGPVTVQATAVNAADIQALGSFSRSSTTDTSSFWNGNGNGDSGRGGGRDSPLDLAVRGASESQSKVSSSSSSASLKHSATSSLAGAAGECSPAKQGRSSSSNDSAYYHHSPYAKPPSQHAAAGVRRSPGQYEGGSRRKLNPAYLTHIKPRNSDDGGRVVRRAVLSSSSVDRDSAMTLTHTSATDDDDLMQVLNLKQEVD